MNVLSGDLQLAVAHDRANRLRAEADSHRLARLARAERPSRLQRASRSLGHGLHSVAESFKVDRRPRIPAI